MREILKKIVPLKFTLLLYRALLVRPNRIARLAAFLHYWQTWQFFRRLPENSAFAARVSDLYPRLFDDTGEHHLDPVYFYQNAWTAKKIFEGKAEKHTDVGSQAELVGMLSQFVPTTMVDIRPLPFSLPGLTFLKGDITALPFRDGTIHSLSSICVLEHIGLGRYGDTLDTVGSEKASRELSRVLAPGGDLYITVPVDTKNKVYFNAHRAFTREYILELFSGLVLKEEVYLYGKEVQSSYEPAKGFGTGFFHFKK